MRPSVPAVACLLAWAVPCLVPCAGRAADPSARAIGRFGDWTAATHQEDGQMVCYAFTRALAAPGDPATLLDQPVAVLSVAERPGARDDVAIDAGFAFHHDQLLQLSVRGTTLVFYTAQHGAFARDGTAAVAVFSQGGGGQPAPGLATAQADGPHGTTMADAFSLHGFPAAYAATVRACPGAP